MSGLGRVLLRNAAFGGGARFVTLAVGLVMTPYLYNRLGTGLFGVWALTGVVNGAFGFFDLSFRTSFIKHLAETHSSGDRRGHDSVVLLALIFYAAFSAIVLVVFLLLRDELLVLLRIPAELSREAAAVFLISLSGFLASVVLSVFPAICDARQRIDLTNSLGVAALVVSTAATVLAVESDLGLVGVALAQLLGILLFHAAAVVLAQRLFTLFPLAVRTPEPSWFRRLFGFGLKLHVSAACVIVNRQFDKFLLTRWSGLPLVTSYEVALRVVGNAGSFQPYLAAALLPAASHLDARGQRRELLALYRRAYRYLFLVGIPPFVFLAATADDVVVAWLGTADSLAAQMLLLLAGGYLVNSLSNAMANVCQGIGRPDIQARQSAIQLALNILLSLLAYRLIGPLGAPLGTSLALVAGAAYFARAFHPLLSVSTTAILREGAAIPFLASLAGATLGTLATSGLSSDDRGSALLSLLMAGVVFVGVFLLICVLTGSLGRTELRQLAGLLRRGGMEVAGGEEERR